MKRTISLMNPDIENLKTWNKIAKIYEDKFMSINIYNESYDLFCDLIKVDNAKVLELGCGPGNITQYIHKKRPDFSIEALDMAPNMIELAQKNCPEVTFKVMDIRKIDQLNSKYNAIICGFCIPYISSSDFVKLVEDCNHLLVDSGLLYLSFVEGNYADSGFQTGSSGDRIYFYYHNLADILAALDKMHFKIVHLIPVSYQKSDAKNEVHTVIIAQKITPKH